MRMLTAMMRQFAHPTGVLGQIAGLIMAYRPSNIERNAWAIELLDIQPTDCVFEIGFGPGVAIERLARMTPEGLIYGIDHSIEMVRQATWRNRVAIRQGRVRLGQASACDLPEFDRPLDKVLAVNNVQFWEDSTAVLRAIGARLRVGGQVVFVQQPRGPGVRDADAETAGRDIATKLREAEFADLRVRFKPMKPVAAVAIMARRPNQGRS